MGFKPILLIFLFYNIVNAQYSETEARHYVDEANENLFRYYDKLISFNFGKTKEKFQLHYDEFLEVVNKIADLTKRAQNFPYKNYQDPELKKALYNIQRSAYIIILGGDNLEKLVRRSKYLIENNTKNNLCKYIHEPYQCKLAYVPDIWRIISQFNGKPEELQYYWEAWRDKSKYGRIILFPRIIESLKIAANFTGVNNLEFWYQLYGSDSKLIDEMEKVMKEIKPFYELIHAFVRYELNNIYGDKVISEKGPIPHNFIELILSQAWKKDGVLEQSYPHKKLPNLKYEIDEHGLKGIENIIDSADDFYKSLGLKPLPSNIRSTSFIKKSEIDGSDCEAEIYDYTPNIRVEYCMQENFQNFLKIHGWMGRIYYAYQKKDLPFAFYNSYNLEEAFGQACILSVSTLKHIKEIGILPNYQYTEQNLLNRLYEMGIHTWFNIPIYFVHAKVMNELFADKITIESVNEYYWKLMEEYVGVEPPVDRTTTSFDLPYKFYENFQGNDQTRKFMSEIMGYQIYESICEKSGQYVKTNLIQYPLHNCDFYGFSEIGKNLTKMMELGSKEPWRQVLSKITNDNSGLSGQSILDYYEPLNVWLQQNIKVNRIFVGWEPSQRVLNKKVVSEELMLSHITNFFNIMERSLKLKYSIQP